MSDLPKMSTWGTQGQKYEICDKAARERNTELGRETESIRSEVEALKQMSATAEELPSGSKPTASYSNGVLHLGIPQGPKGDTGDTGPQGPAGEAGVTPNITVTAVTGEPGTDAQVEQIGTVENPVLKFTIPRGNDGYVGADGAPGANGQGVPTGGTTGQVLRKTGSGDYEAEWSDKAGDSEKLGGVAAGLYARKNDVPAYNLLDNSDFRNPVNQNGHTSYMGSGYTIDRWRSWDSGFSMTVSSGSITVSGGMLTQYIEKSLNGIYTLAAMTSSGTLYLLTANMNDAMTYEGNLGMGTPTDGFQAVSIGPGTYIWAALYEGTFTAEALPPYVQKGYASEMAECRSYLKTLPEQTTVIFATNIQGDRYFSNSVSFEPMRINPSVTFVTDEDGNIGLVQSVSFLTQDSISIGYTKNGCIVLYTTNENYAGRAASFYGIRLDANL